MHKIFGKKVSTGICIFVYITGPSLEPMEFSSVTQEVYWIGNHLLLCIQFLLLVHQVQNVHCDNMQVIQVFVLGKR